MEPNNRMVDWMVEFLEWSDTEARGCALGGAGGDAARDAGEDFRSAYLDWMGEEAPGHETGIFLDAGASDGDTDDELGGLDVFRESLLVALQTESDCIQFLRRVLDAGGASPGTMDMAFEALEHAERLLEDERRAWRALAALGQFEPAQSQARWRSGFEADWPHVLDEVAADVHALTGRVLALRAQ